MNRANIEDIALFDLDGTLADYAKAMMRDLESIRGPHDSPYLEFGNNPDYIEKRTRLIRKIPGWWENLEELKQGFDILEVAKNLGFTINILTKSPNSVDNAWTEKFRWSSIHVPGANVTMTQDKSLVYGKVLVDDYPGYIEGWLAVRPRGLVIMPGHEYNRGYEHERIIRYDGTNIDEVKRALTITKLRNPNHPLILK